MSNNKKLTKTGLLKIGFLILVIFRPLQIFEANHDTLGDKILSTIIYVALPIFSIGVFIYQKKHFTYNYSFRKIWNKGLFRNEYSEAAFMQLCSITCLVEIIKTLNLLKFGEFSFGNKFILLGSIAFALPYFIHIATRKIRVKNELKAVMITNVIQNPKDFQFEFETMKYPNIKEHNENYIWNKHFNTIIYKRKTTENIDEVIKDLTLLVLTHYNHELILKDQQKSRNAF